MRDCLFCSTHLNRSNRSREHVIPKWLVSRFEVNRCFGTHWTYPNEPIVILDEREHAALSLVLGNVCQGCNTGWMAQLEEGTRPLMEALWDGRSPTVLTFEKCNTIAKWTFKTAATLNYSVDYKRIIPLEHIRHFHTTGRLPENATVDLALCRRVGINWILGGNKRFVVISKKITESQKRATYVISLQFDHLLLKLSWVPVDGVKAVAAPSNAVYRICPQDNTVQVIRRRIFRDHAHFHFIGTILAEEGIYPSDLDF